MRVYNYLIIIMGLITLFALAGIPTVSSKILVAMNVLDNPEGITLTDFFSNIYSMIASIVVVGTILIGLYMKSSPESYLLIPYTTTLFLFIADLVSVITYMNTYGTWVSTVTMLILGPLTLGYVHSIISWWGNKA